MFRSPFSWISDPRGSDKVVNADLEAKMAYATRPVVEILSAASMGKRKRSPSVDVLDGLQKATVEPKRQKVLPLKGETPLVVEPSLPALDLKREPAVVGSSRIRETIDSQFSLEILLKHNELRLINQELAKCQVALEQLRRCHLIPYPTAQATTESMLNVANGTGPAVGYGANVPQYAPAFGVADGPYSRHYSRWLIPDPSFDGVQVEWHRVSDGSRAGKGLLEGRSTRYSVAEGMALSSKSRSHRGSQGQKLQALSSGYPQEKAKVGPCVLKRADGQTVKLVCIDCNRENFSSTQGFINHCRIAHRREFKSHEEAAVTSGHPYEADESGAPPMDEKTPAPTPTVANGLVHPLIRTAPTDPEAFKALLNRIDTGLALFQQGKLPGVTSIPTSANSTPLKGQTSTMISGGTLLPSADTPNLSDWLRSKGFGGDLSKMVGEAKTKIDFEDILSQDEDSDAERTPTTPQMRLGVDGPEPAIPAMRVPARAAMSPGPNRPGSSKGLDLKGTRPGLSGISPRLAHATPVINTSSSPFRPVRVINDIRPDDLDSFHGSSIDLDMMDAPSAPELSPNTISSNNAPSLVSDDGEYDDGDDAESATSGDEDVDSVAEIDIEDDGVDKVVARTVLHNRARNGGDAMRMAKEDKHVTFMSPVKESGKERRRK